VAIVQPTDVAPAECGSSILEGFLDIEHHKVQTGIGTSLREASVSIHRCLGRRCPRRPDEHRDRASFGHPIGPGDGGSRDTVHQPRIGRERGRDSHQEQKRKSRANPSHGKSIASSRFRDRFRLRARETPQFPNRARIRRRARERARSENSHLFPIAVLRQNGVHSAREAG